MHIGFRGQECRDLGCACDLKEHGHSRTPCSEASYCMPRTVVEDWKALWISQSSSLVIKINEASALLCANNGLGCPVEEGRKRVLENFFLTTMGVGASISG